MKELLTLCGINENNFGSCVGGMDWISTKNAGENISYCPSNESVIATVYEAKDDDYDHIASEATSASSLTATDISSTWQSISFLEKPFPSNSA